MSEVPLYVKFGGWQCTRSHLDGNMRAACRSASFFFFITLKPGVE